MPTMLTRSFSPNALVAAIHSLLENFHGRLTGSRQATRTQLVQFLARELDISDTAAGKLFDDLREAGVIVRGDEELTAWDLPERNEQSWSIDAERSNAADFDSDVEPATVGEKHTQAMDLLRRAIHYRATDIHLDPFGDETEVRLRIDGQLEHCCRLDETIGEQLATQFKVLANLDPSKHFSAQEGRLTLPVSLSDYDVRITVTPVINGESLSLRLLRREQIIRPLDTLGLAADDLRKLRQQMTRGAGIVLVGGPSGAGKTTTLYSLVHDLDDGRLNIVTIEDPVEYLIPGFAQIQFDRKRELSLASGLKTALRMDPDILLLGEIRDTETAAAALRAASSGKFVFTTFHTRDAASVVTASRDLRVDDRSLASNLRAIISQRLVRRLCSRCRDTRPMNDVETGWFDAAKIDPPKHIAKAVGCQHCHQTGYYERIGVFEIAVVTEEIANAIEQGITEIGLRELLRANSVTSLTKDGLQKVRDGLTTIEEVRGMHGFSP